MTDTGKDEPHIAIIIFKGDEDTTGRKSNSAWNGVGPPPEDNGKAELYAQECTALKELIDKHGWPEGWPRRGVILQKSCYGYEDIVVSVIKEVPTHKDTWIRADSGAGMFASTVYPAPCGETVLMLMEWLGDDLDFIKHRFNEKIAWSVYYWKNKWRTANACIDSESLTLALCAAVMAKLEEEHD